MEVRYSNTLGDLVRFNLYHLPRMGIMQVMFAGLVVLHTCTFGRDIAKLNESTPMKVGVFLITFVLFFTALIFLQFLLILFSYRPSKNKALLTEHVIRVSDEGLVEETALGSTACTWNGVPNVGQNRRYIFLYVQQNMAHIIPKAAFVTPAAASDFVRFVMSRVAEGKA